MQQKDKKRNRFVRHVRELLNKSLPIEEQSMGSSEAFKYVRETLGHKWMGRSKFYRIVWCNLDALGVVRTFVPNKNDFGKKKRGGNYIFTSRRRLDKFPWTTA